MHTEFLMGNEAIAMGALAAGVNLVCGYPGTPSTEVLETVAAHRPENVWVEWSVNEKTAMEMAGGAALSGARALVTMKQMGLNVASDPLMCLEYLGVKGGLVVLVADDPGPISSQTEQDTRTFAAFAKVPCFDPSSAQEAYEMIQEAFAFSEEHGTPVFLRPTTRVSHGYATVQVKDPAEYTVHTPSGFEKDSRWVIFPRLSNMNHQKIEERNARLSEVLSGHPANRTEEADMASATCRKGIATGGFSYTYAMEAREHLGKVPLLKIGIPFPFPEEKAAAFLSGLDEVLCIEELDPVIERGLIYVCGKYNLNVKILGKQTGHMPRSGENTRDSVLKAMAAFLGVPLPARAESPDLPPLPVRPPVLCAGCPHRASFYAVKQAMKGRKTIFCGDIGCYTLGNAMPLDMVDTCLCMGAGLGIAQALSHLEADRSCFAFVGDSTFFASALPGVVNAVYNQASFTLIVLDNSTTAMTGHQPHPGTGRTMMGEKVNPVSIEQVLKGIGVSAVETVDPLNLPLAIDTIRRVADMPGVKAVVFRSPCVALTKPAGRVTVDADKCIGCKKCIREIGCPALSFDGKKASADPAQCTGCGLCAGLCPVGAISGGAAHAE